jgi:hypothetical protein
VGAASCAVYCPAHSSAFIDYTASGEGYWPHCCLPPLPATSSEHPPGRSHALAVTCVAAWLLAGAQQPTATSLVIDPPVFIAASMPQLPVFGFDKELDLDASELDQDLQPDLHACELGLAQDLVAANLQLQPDAPRSGTGLESGVLSNQHLHVDAACFRSASMWNGSGGC